ncbi:MAG: cyclic nucleotide-binding domain-containing protein [Bacteroidota bacterium]
MIKKEISDQAFTQKVLSLFEKENDQRVYSRGDFLLQEGQVEHHLYFIEKGAVKLYYLTEFEERIIRFGYDGSLINSLSSFLNGSPSEFYIEAIRKTYVKRIPKALLMSVITKNYQSVTQYSKFLETVLIHQIDREIDLMVSSPTQRLERVLKRSPDLFKHVPLKYIASYLRMNPETLSRIRNS